MIKVVVGNNMKQVSVIVDEASSVKAVAEAAGFDVGAGMVCVNGCFLQAGGENKTLRELNCTDNARILIGFKKSDNANN